MMNDQLTTSLSRRGRRYRLCRRRTTLYTVYTTQTMNWLQSDSDSTIRPTSVTGRLLVYVPVRRRVVDLG